MLVLDLAGAWSLCFLWWAREEKAKAVLSFKARDCRGHLERRAQVVF